MAIAYYIIRPESRLHQMLVDFHAKRVAVIQKLKVFGELYGVHLIHKNYKAFTLKPGVERGVGCAWRKHRDDPEKSVPNRSNQLGRMLVSDIQALPSVPGGIDLMMAWQSVVNEMHAEWHKTHDTGLKRPRKSDIMAINQTGTAGCFSRDGVFAVNIDTYWMPDDMTGIDEITHGVFATYANPPVPETKDA